MLILREVKRRRSDDDYDGANGDSASSGVVEIEAAVQVVNNLTTAQVRRNAPSLIFTKDLGRPKEFSDKEEDFQRSG